MGRGNQKNQTALEEESPVPVTLSMEDVFAQFKEADPNEPDWRGPIDFTHNEARQFSRYCVFKHLESIPGVGEGLAERITERLGVSSLEEIDADPEILRNLQGPGVSGDTIDYLILAWHEIRASNPDAEIDPAVAAHILSLDYQSNFDMYHRWYFGSTDLIASPEETAEGMTDAGKMLAQTIENGDKVAVFCDYDVDGTTAGEVFRRSLEPYGADLHFGYASAADGFGLTHEFVQDAAADGCKVLVTLDCGSGQWEAISYAQSLGMKVVVADHHETGEDDEKNEGKKGNTADFHLNPQLKDPPSSENTGAQLAWKLGAAVQEAREGEVRAEHYQESMFLAGMGAVADMGSVMLIENRAFFSHPRDYPAPGVAALARELGEETVVGSMIQTQAAMNLPKRTSKVDADLVASLLAARSEGDAKPIARQLAAQYKSMRPTSDEMKKKAIEQVGEAEYKGDGAWDRPQPDKRIAHAVLDEEYDEYAGFSGPIASTLSKAAQKPAVVFVARGKDSEGKTVYKWSSRNSVYLPGGHQLGEVADNPEMLEACTVEQKDEDGNISRVPSFGGHEAVLSGSCTEENIDKVVSCFEDWAQSKGNRFFSNQPYPPPWITERNVAPERLPAIERQARRLGPYSSVEGLTEPRKKGQAPKKKRNKQISISVRGTLSDMRPDPENEGWLQGRLLFSDGQEREVRYPADADPAPEKEAEWVLRMGSKEPYFLRHFAETRRPEEA